MTGKYLLKFWICEIYIGALFSCNFIFADLFETYTRRNFSLVARYSLKFTSCLLLFVKSLVTRCKICSLLVPKFARYSLKKLLAVKSHLLLVSKLAGYLLQKLLDAMFAWYLLEMLLFAKKHSLLVTKKSRELMFT